MALGITKTYTPSSGQATDASAYNTDLAALFNAFSGLEAQTSSLGGLTITPAANSTTTFKVTNTIGTSLLSVDTTNSSVIMKTGTRLYLDSSSGMYISNNGTASLDFYVDNTLSLSVRDDYVLIPSGKLGFQSISVVYLNYNTNTASLDFYFNAILMSIFETYTYTPNQIRIGTDSANNGIDDATGGTASTPLYIGNQIIGVSSGTTGGTGSAGSGKQYVQLKIGATTYKILTDGSI